MINGFAPSFYDIQNSAGLQMYVSPGTINKIRYNGTVVNLTAGNINYVSVDNGGNVSASTSGYPSANPVAIVVTGAIVTSGSTPANKSGQSVVYSQGVISITDTRSFG